MAQTNINIRIDENLEKDFDEICSDSENLWNCNQNLIDKKPSAPGSFFVTSHPQQQKNFKRILVC